MPATLEVTLNNQVGSFDFNSLSGLRASDYATISLRANSPAMNYMYGDRSDL